MLNLKSFSIPQIAQSLAHLLPPVLKDKFICDRPLEVRPVELCGYDFKLGTNEQFEEATKKYINIPSYNDSGYILDAGDYIVVKVGNYSPNFYEFLYE